MKVMNRYFRPRVHFIEEMMGNTVSLLHRCLHLHKHMLSHFGCRNVQAVVHLHRVGIDDFPVEPMCQLNGKLCLSDSFS